MPSVNTTSIARQARLASLVANDKICRGPGLIPLRQSEVGLINGKAWREQQAAFDIAAGLRPFDVNEETLIDWGLKHESIPNIHEAYNKVDSSPELRAVIESTTEERKTCLLQAKAEHLAKDSALCEVAAREAARAAYETSPSITIAEWCGDLKAGIWPPTRMEFPRVMKAVAIPELPLQERKELSYAWCTSKLYTLDHGNGGSGQKGKGKNIGSATSILKEAAAIFGTDGAVMSKTALCRRVKEKVGLPPTPGGRPKKLKAEWLKNKRAAAGALAEEEAAKRTNIESPPGGEGHVASNNGGAGMAI
mmetsp:Transcript_58416/g.110160  ORF Transcript_58416/g.110160 Transcript_58416/m.110160 type:complete len:307 (+) Transcript_58416:116-1036(+)